MSRVPAAALAFTLLGGQALAAGSSCYSLPGSTQDERNRRTVCQALANQDRLKCASVAGDTDLKRLCEAQASGDPRPCYSISTADGRNYCKGVVGGR